VKSAPHHRDFTGTPGITVEAVAHRYPDGTLALEGVSMAVAAGEALAVTGPTGSGKSTLIRHLNGLLRPTSGRVLLEGEDVRGLRVAQLARRVGIAFQEPDRQLFCRTVRAEVGFGARNETAAADALDALGLAGAADQHPYDLGYSRRKLVAIAAVLAMETPVVVLDEPTTGQDRAGVERLVALMGGLRARGRTLVVVSHHERFVRATCDRAVRLVGGRMGSSPWG
jgi:energy-coupling factor transport system ATP-binding protein